MNRTMAGGGVSASGESTRGRRCCRRMACGGIVERIERERELRKGGERDEGDGNERRHVTCSRQVSGEKGEVRD